ncbi:L-aspartate oxidase [Cognatiluteimonas weifangensis]|uniref:L-aspartate oxidase n=1 Tax=Cognatiluteimonas weifangensis TaxID=2303539 RepID=A0A372DI02_9GAMM|nr:L-aspartate oxidase [Luteimonas weifangensis]RFP59200.1 L-aspartate oxidase [Luteimonas weifangensis]
MAAPRQPLVVVGHGVAGLSAALAAAPAPVLLVNRARHGEGGASLLAQGGIAAALAPGDSTAAHARDTIAAGAGHNDRDAVLRLTAAAPAAIAWLQAQGVAFDQDARGGLALGREGGHGVARIVHAGGDRSGARVTAALLARARAAAHIQWREQVDADALLLRAGAVVGVRLRDAAGRCEPVEAGAVVLATGGLGALFAHTTNPAASAGSGLALALAAGARVRDLEFVQFHPTALRADADGATLPLITEALRGAGARLRDHRGQLLMAFHPLADLAPRDIVARTVWQAQRKGPVWLDASALAPGWEAGFPTVLAACRAQGIDPRSQPIPVTPAAHFHMGGIAVDADGASSLPGLYAVGEVACNGVHGANRLASNSLLEGVVCGRRTGQVAAQRARASTPSGAATRLCERGPDLGDAERTALRDLLWRAAGPVRTGEGLRQAQVALRTLADSGWEARLATALLEAALRRPGSLGAHWREADAAPAGVAPVVGLRAGADAPRRAALEKA